VSRSELREHAGYFRDRVKFDAYERALRQLIAPGDVVIDLGSGTGLLGLLALKAGAARVYMVDSGPILGVALELARANGFADRVVPIRAHSSDAVLPELADVIVCDQIGGLVYDAGVLDFFADARRRLLKPEGRLVPDAFTLFLAPVTAPGPREDVDLWNRHPHGLNTAAVHRLAVNTEWRVDPESVTTLADPARIGRIASWKLERVESAATFEFTRRATVDGFLGWFDAELAPGIHVTNAPGQPERMQRWCNFYPTARRLAVEPGDTLVAGLDIRPDLETVNWSACWSRGEQSLGRWRHSTLLGQFLGPEDLLGATVDRPVQAIAAGKALATALQRVNGQRSSDAIIDEVLRQHPDAFPSSARARSVLGRELAKWARVVR
jgi:protein arginine N-methyltransferase 1